MTRRHTSPVPQNLVERIGTALAAVDTTRAELDAAVGREEGLLVLRQVHAEVSAAFEDADRLLRQATSVARKHSHQRGFFQTWTHWRHALSQLDVAKQTHLFAEADDLAIPLGTIQTLDTGMSGPAIGDLLHGESTEPGSAPAYGINIEAMLVERAGAEAAPVPQVTPTASAAPLTPPVELAAA